MLYNALSVGKTTPKIVTFLWNFITLLEEDQATAIGNMHKTCRKDSACDSGDILADRQTCTDLLITIHHNRSMGEVIMCFMYRRNYYVYVT